MTVFRFRLQRVLDWRRTQLDGEEARLKQLAAALEELDRAKLAVKESGRRAQMEVRGFESVCGNDLAALGAFLGGLEKRQADIAARRVEGEKKFAEQQAAMQEARRRYRLLERLKERRWEEWRAASNKELEELAGESYAAQWARKRSGSL